jgi:hypothetical protein
MMRPSLTALVAATAVASGCLHTSARADASTKLRKDEVGPAVKRVIPRLANCYKRVRARDPQISGVINTKLTVQNDPKLGMTLHVDGFDTSGPLGESREFLDCAKRTFESTTLPPLNTRGRLFLIYPSTFAPQPPDNHDAAIVVQAARAADEGRWSDALQDAEHGLQSTSLDGTYRRRLIEIAGLAVCHLKHEVKARFYFALAPAWAEARMQQVCRDVASIELLP